MKKNNLIILFLIAAIAIAWNSKKRKAGDLILTLDEGEYLPNYKPLKPAIPNNETKKLFDI
jgi:hypothetical protein